MLNNSNPESAGEWHLELILWWDDKPLKEGAVLAQARSRSFFWSPNKQWITIWYFDSTLEYNEGPLLMET